MSKGSQKAIVIGAGVGGTATAARLAKAGFDVTVVEKNDYLGGRCSLIHDGDYRFDRGPSLFLLPGLFEEAFYDLDTTMKAEGVNLLKCEPNYIVHFSDGESLELSTDTAKMKKQVEKWEGKDGFHRYLDFMREAHLHYEISITHVLQKNFTSFLSMLRPSFLIGALSLHPFESVYSRASRYFWTERLRRAFTFGSMYMGMSPFNAPGTYSLLQYTELAEGIWYPVGGFNKVVQALVSVGKRFGVTYRLSTPVKQVLLSSDGQRATGVALESGEHLFADVVVVNADLVYAFNNLLPPSNRAKQLSSKPGSCSSISFYWAMDRTVPELSTHNVFLADEYQESFDDIFDKHQMPKDPSFYVNVPSRIDPSAAPAGKDSIVVLVPVGHLTDDQQDGLAERSPQDWDEMVSRARRTIFATIEARTGAKNLQASVVSEFVNTPQSWKDELNLDKGAILGLSHSFLNVLSFRPTTKHPSYKSLYFVGASTHPGTGVPICLAGSKITSDQILGDYGMRVPWSGHGPPSGVRREGIDRYQRKYLVDSWSLWIIIAVLLAYIFVWTRT